jgi:uncharacterized protein
LSETIKKEPIARAVIFCVVTFVISWSFWIYSARLGDESSWTFDSHYIKFAVPKSLVIALLGNAAPGYVAIALWLLEGKGLRTVFSRLSFPRRPILLLIPSLLGPIGAVLVMVISQAGTGLNGSGSLTADIKAVDLARLTLINLPLGPFWEELGWRGFLFDHLQRRGGVGQAALFSGLVWGAWHAPLYLLVLHSSFRSYLLSYIAIVGLSVSLSILYRASGYSILLPVLFHAVWNASNNAALDSIAKFDSLPVVLEAAAVWTLAGLLWLIWTANRSVPFSSQDCR